MRLFERTLRRGPLSCVHPAQWEISHDVFSEKETFPPLLQNVVYSLYGCLESVHCEPFPSRRWSPAGGVRFPYQKDSRSLSRRGRDSACFAVCVETPTPKMSKGWCPTNEILTGNMPLSEETVVNHIRFHTVTIRPFTPNVDPQTRRSSEGGRGTLGVEPPGTQIN